MSQKMNKKILAPAMFLYENVFDYSEELISFMENNNSSVYDSKIQDGLDILVDNSTRKSKVFSFSKLLENKKLYLEIMKTISQCGKDYSQEMQTSYDYIETFQVLKYEGNEGFFSFHDDDIKNKKRIFSLLLYLNNVEEGGETFFKNFDLAVAPREGSVLLFPSNFAYLHQARIPENKNKYVIATWFGEEIKNELE